MLAKKYRLPVQTVLNKRAKSVHKSRHFFIKIFEGAEDYNRFAVLVSKKVNPKASGRNKLKRAVFQFLQESPPPKTLGDVLIILKKEADATEGHVIIEELKKILKDI